MCMCGYVHMYAVPTESRRGRQKPIVGFAHCYDLPRMGAGNRTLVHWTSSECSYLLSHPSSPLDICYGVLWIHSTFSMDVEPGGTSGTEEGSVDLRKSPFCDRWALRKPSDCPSQILWKLPVAMWCLVLRDRGNGQEEHEELLRREEWLLPSLCSYQLSHNGHPVLILMTKPYLGRILDSYGTMAATAGLMEEANRLSFFL